MFAVIKTGGKQYSVSAEDVITIEKILGVEVGDPVVFDEVLMLSSENDGLLVGAPFLDGKSVKGEVVERLRAPKVIAFKKRRRQNSKRKRGHRQQLVRVRILGEDGGALPPTAAKSARKTVEKEAAVGPKETPRKSASVSSTAAQEKKAVLPKNQESETTSAKAKDKTQK